MATMSFVHSFMIDFPMFILLQAMVEAEALDHKVDLVAAEAQEDSVVSAAVAAFSEVVPEEAGSRPSKMPFTLYTNIF